MLLVLDCLGCLSSCVLRTFLFFFFFLNDPAPPEISPLPLHAALPIGACPRPNRRSGREWTTVRPTMPRHSNAPCRRREKSPARDRSRWPCRRPCGGNRRTEEIGRAHV